MDRRVVLGAGPLGTSVARQLEERGSSVLLASVLGSGKYDMPGTRPPVLDGQDVAQITDFTESAAALYLCLTARYRDWYDEFPPIVAAAIQGAARSGTRLVYADDVALYGPVDAALAETLPAAATTRKGALRAKLAMDVEVAHASGRAWTTIGRAADMYGPGALDLSLGSTFGEQVFRAALNGKALNLVGDLDAPHTYGYVDDLARGLITLGDAAEAGGETWHLPTAPTLTRRELVAMAYEHAGNEPRVRSTTAGEIATRLGSLFRPDLAEASEVLYQVRQPLIVDHTKFETKFGAETTPHEQAVETTLEWYRAHPSGD